MKSIITRVILLAVSGYMLFSLISLFNNFNTQNTEYKKLLSARGEQQHEIEKYKELLADGNEAKIIEKAARERLGYVFSNEEIYIDISRS